MYLTLIAKQDLTPTIKGYVFTSENPLIFKPGQFVRLTQPGAPLTLARAFSCASAPENSEITFIMKHIPDGHISGYLANAPLGTKIESSAPLGRFTLNPEDPERVFVATGTGIAPIVSFLEAEQKIPTKLLFGVRNESDIFWKEKLPADSLITLSQPSDNWTGTQGRVTAHTLQLIQTHPLAAWYICGSPAMVTEVRAQLLAAHVPQTQIHFEMY